MSNSINPILTTDILTDTNHHLRRFFRCWLDGSYHGEGSYRRNCEIARENYNAPKRLRAHVISEWCQYLAADYSCSTGTVQKAMVAFFTGNQLDVLNDELIDDLRDLVRDEVESEDE